MPQGPFPVSALCCTPRHRRLSVLTALQGRTPLLPAAPFPFPKVPVKAAQPREEKSPRDSRIFP